ncbi:DUF6319 family protein [Gordonia humi]|uniref:DUF6319 family protein n=1 Tax=Gordonia humi TaxID=686429 RepID=UPI00360943B0
MAESLTPDDLTRLSTALAEGRRATVYLREAVPSLGLGEGASARVVSIAGNTVTISPRGVDDELPYEADELRISKVAPPEAGTGREGSGQEDCGEEDCGEEGADRRSRDIRTDDRLRRPRTPDPRTPDPGIPDPGIPDPGIPDLGITETPASQTAGSRTPKSPASTSTPKQPAKRASKKSTQSVTVTIYGTADNEWSVAMTRGAEKPQRSRSVTPEAVDAAVDALGDQTSRTAVTALLSAAREEAQRRVEELSRELEAAKEALAALENS